MPGFRDTDRPGVHAASDKDHPLGGPGHDTVSESERPYRGQLAVHQGRHDNGGRRRRSNGKSEQLVEPRSVDAVAWPAKALYTSEVLRSQQVDPRQGLAWRSAPHSGQRRHFRRRPQRTLSHRIIQILSPGTIERRRGKGAAHRGLGRYPGSVPPHGGLAQQRVDGISRMSGRNTDPGEGGNGRKRVGGLGHSDRR